MLTTLTNFSRAALLTCLLFAACLTSTVVAQPVLAPPQSVTTKPSSAIQSQSAISPGQPQAAISPANYQHPVQNSTQFEQGKPNKLIDGVGWVMGIPQKLILWDRRAENHDISSETQVGVAEYVAVNEIDSVKVRFNQYDPVGEWKRLVKNKRVGAGWRYTLGTLSTLGYTLLPGRLVGTDHYNPYTDTVHIYSDIPSIALEQAAYAHDVHQQDKPGTYATVQSLPFVGLMHESKNKKDVHEFLSEYGTPEAQAEARRILDSQMGSEFGAHIGSVVPGAEVPIQLTGAAIGHVVGRHHAKNIVAE